MDITEKVEQFLSQYDLLSKNNTIIVAFSGGYDSLCLLDIVKKLSLKHEFHPVAVHLNHNWRGKESKQDELNCKNFAIDNNIEFYCETLSSKVKQNETAAREARYDFFKRCADKFKSKCILTAHNADDNAETVLYRIIKGTGVKGLEGIKEKREIFYRPLLHVYRNDIEEYCSVNNLKPNIDSSNEDTKYKRNLIRHKIIPLIEEIKPSAKQAVNSLSEISIYENEMNDEYLIKIFGNCFSKINSDTFFKSNKAVQLKVLYKIFTLNKLDYSKERIQNALDFINENINSKSGKIFSLNDNLWLFVNHKYITTVDNTPDNFDILKINKEGEYKSGKHTFLIQKCNKKPTSYPQDNEYKAYIDLSRFDFNFTLRNRLDGDIIQPYGVNGTQKLKKYLNNKKIPNYKKSSLILLCRENEVLWACGIGISDKIKVVNEPTHVVELKEIRGNNED